MDATTDPAVLAYAVAQLRANGEADAADALMAQSGDQKPSPVTKAASTLTLADGAALVPEGAPRKPKKKDGRALVARVLKALEAE